MGTQATGYEKVANGCPDCVTAYYTIMCSEGWGGWKSRWSSWPLVPRDTGEAWLEYELHSLLSCTFWSIKISWMTSSQRAKRPLMHCMIMHLDSHSQGDGGCWHTHKWWLGNHCAPGRYASHHPYTLGIPYLYIYAHQFHARGLCWWALAEDECYGSHAHMPPLQKQSEGIGCAAWRDY